MKEEKLQHHESDQGKEKKRKNVINVDLMDEKIIDISMDLLREREIFNILILTHRCKHEAREGNDEVA